MKTIFQIFQHKISLVNKLKFFFKLSMKNNRLFIFNEQLAKIDKEVGAINSPDIPKLFSKFPLDEFGKLLLDIPQQYPHLKEFFPSMAAKEVQKNWTGSYGEVLLYQSVAFIKTMVYGYSFLTGKNIAHAKVLDFGCGWGRLIRLLYKYVPVSNIYGLDPWDQSINICKQNRIKGNLALSDNVPLSLPFSQQFDLIFAYSVFTHLSEKTTRIVLSTLRKYVSEDGILVITVRPKEYWHIHNNGEIATEMLKLHNDQGFAFKPHNLPPIDGDITYGDTSMTLAYFEKSFPNWKIAAVECNDMDLYQVILFLRPA